MMHRWMGVSAVLFAAAAVGCAGSDWLTGASKPSIAGEYILSAVDSQPLPCCGTPDASGARVTVLSGTLTLGDAAPEAFVATPAGYYPSSCVHEVPNGGTAGTAPRCGDGDFTLTLNERLDYADGTSKTATAVSRGLYAWTSDTPSMIKLVDVPMLGSIARSSGPVRLDMRDVNVMGTFGPTYRFVTAR